MQSFLSLIKNPAWDAVLVFMLVAAGFFWGISGGKKKMAMGIVAIYVLTALFPFVSVDYLASGRAPNEAFMFGAGAFLILLVLLALFLLRAFRGVWKEDGAWWEILVFAILAAGFLMTSLIGLAQPSIAKNNFLNLSPLTLKLFADPIIAK